MKGSRVFWRMSQYLVDGKVPVKITIGVAPHLDIPAHTWTFGGCFGLGFSFRRWPRFLKHKHPWWSSCTDDSSLKIMSSKVSLSVCICWHHSSCFCWLVARMSWQYLGLVLIQLRSSLRARFIVLKETLNSGHLSWRMLKSDLAMSSSLAAKDLSINRSFSLSSFLSEGRLGQSTMVLVARSLWSESK